MKRNYLLSLFTILTLGCTTPKLNELPTDLVDVQIGATHCRWFFYTPAALPFGMAKLAPTTDAYNSPGSWMPNGYDSRHTSIEGFAHLHEFQIGGIVVTPTNGELKTLPGSQENPDEGYRSRYEKTTEQSEPGYYKVTLADYDIDVELTATERVGYHRYKFNQGGPSRLLFDIGHPQGESATVVDAYVNYNSEKNEVSGYVECYPVYATFCDIDNTVKAYFVAYPSVEPSDVGTFIDATQTDNSNEVKGVGAGMWLAFNAEAGDVVEMQVGLSYTSIDGARANYLAEGKGQTFDKVRSAATDRWNAMLGKIQVEGGEKEDRVKFYTGLYHALLGRGLASDVDGKYITHDKQIATAHLDSDGKPKYHHYNTDGMWGGFWNLTQVWTLAYPDQFDGYVRSNLDFSRHTGWLHDGEAAGVYTNGVQTNFQGLIAVAAYNAGILDYDLDYLWEMVRKNELDYQQRDLGSGKYDLDEFVTRGYVPLSNYVLPNGWSSNFGASHTLEYSFSSYAASELARQLGYTATADTLRRLANGYQLLFDNESGYCRPREKNGEFLKDFDPLKGWLGFQEGNGAQYTWYAPHDVAGLINLIGLDRFNERLEKTFDDASLSGFGGKPGEFDSFSGVEKLYNHGNQPCLHNSFLFNYSAKPWLTQKFTRQIMDSFYGTTAEHGYGYGQDEDQGQLGAWYVLASIGLFDVQGGTRTNPTFQIGSPKFDKITIQLDSKYYKGKEFIIETTGNAPSSYYVQSATLNGKSLENCWFDFSSIKQGGKLSLSMGDTPNKTWGVQTPPPSMSTDDSNPF
ncbi:MAG: GH92 family glycosyl hydrolase [Phocaeicola sp.]